MNPNKIMVAVMTYERYKYLSVSLSSLFCSNIPQGKTELMLFDDKSVSVQKVEQLDALSELPFLTVLKHNERVRPRGQMGRILRKFLDDFNSDYVIIVQDDIVYSKDWYSSLIAAVPQIPNLGVLSAWDHVDSGREPSEVLLDRGDGVVEAPFIERGVGKNYVGGPCLLLTRKFVKALEKRNPEFLKDKGTGEDLYVQKRCDEYGFKVYALNPSVVEHFGDISMVDPVKERRYRAWNRDVGVDSNAVGFKLFGGNRKYLKLGGD